MVSEQFSLSNNSSTKPMTGVGKLTSAWLPVEHAMEDLGLVPDLQYEGKYSEKKSLGMFSAGGLPRTF